MSICDYAPAYSLWMGAAGVGLRSVDDSREGIAKFLTRNPGSCFVAEDGNQIVGTILCGHDGRRGYIYHAMVASAHRQRGIGRELVEAGLAALRAEGINRVGLVAFRSNENGAAFWKAVGFERREDLSYWNVSLNGENR